MHHCARQDRRTVVGQESMLISGPANRSEGPSLFWAGGVEEGGTLREKFLFWRVIPDSGFW